MSSKKTNGASRRWSLVGGASMIAAAAAAMSATPALAQDDAEEEEAVIVTGTRIPQPNLYTTSPVTQVTGEDITTQGVTRVEDMTNQLPQVFAAQGSNVSNGASGTAEVNLRGIGPSRTLVLIDGRRMGYGSPNSVPADLNQIPGPLVERVEVLTGGASAVYGSDAVAGVVNFIMRDNFEGFRLDAQYGFFQHTNDSDDGLLREEIAFRAGTNPAQFSLPADDIEDGYSKEITTIFGASTSDGRGNVTAYLSYRTNDAVLQRDRDYSACALGTASVLTRPYAPAGSVHWMCGGSGTGFPGRFTDFGGNFNGTDFEDSFAENQTVASQPSFNFTIDQTTGEFTGYDTALNDYNYGPLNYYQRPDERYALGVFARYELNPRIEVYGSAMFNDYRSIAQIAPSGDFFSTSTINCDNPLLTSDMQLLLCGDGETGYKLEEGAVVPDLGADDAPGGLNTPGDDGIFGDDPTTDDVNEGRDDVYNVDSLPCADPDPDTAGNQCTTLLYIGRRNVEGGGRQDDLNHQSYRVLLGVRGPLTDAWDYDLSGQFYRVSLVRSYLNDFSITRLNRALDVIDADPGEGVDPQCRSFVSGADPNCVPYNVFTPGGLTQEAVNYLQIPLLQRGESTMQNVIGTLTGELPLRSPMAQSNMAASFGLEYRREANIQTVDENFATGNASGQGGPTLPLSGEIDVFEVFGEGRLPLVEGAAFADLISIDAAYRYSEYNNGVETEAYKFGADWAPSDDVRLRGSFQRAVRAANIIELFASPAFSLFDMDDDPCAEDKAGDGIAPASNCVGTNPWNVSGSQYGSASLNSPAGQYSHQVGGNPDLVPEEADTRTLGFVFTPSSVPSLAISVDYFNIEVTSLISTTGATNIVSDCYTNGNLESCMRITRNPGSGHLWIGDGHVENRNVNIGGLQTSGYDINASYSMDVGNAGSLTFNLIGTFLDELITDPGETAGVPPYDCVGGYGQQLCGSPNPEWRHRFRVSWETPWSIDLHATWRYYGEVARYDSDGVPVDCDARVDPPPAGNVNLRPNALDCRWDAEHYLDLAGNWDVFENTRLRFGVNNVLDNDPPLSNNVGVGGNGNTYPQVYDSLGRWVFAGITVDF